MRLTSRGAKGTSFHVACYRVAARCVTALRTAAILHYLSGSTTCGDATPCMQVSFRCNLCGASNTHATNPHAWQRGSVFMRCQGCTAVHKMRDNLEIFQELEGPVFPPPHLRNSFLMQDLLDRIAARRQEEGLGALDDDGMAN